MPQDVVASSSLKTTFDMIGGLGDMKDEIMDIVRDRLYSTYILYIMEYIPCADSAAFITGRVSERNWRLCNGCGVFFVVILPKPWARYDVL